MTFPSRDVWIQERWRAGLAWVVPGLSHPAEKGSDSFSERTKRKGEKTLVDTGKLERDNVLVPLDLRFYEFPDYQRHFQSKIYKKVLKRQYLIDHNFGAFIHSPLRGG